MLNLKGFSLAGLAEALSAINQVAPAETQAVINIVPGGVGTDITGDITLAEGSLAILTGLVAAFAAAKAKSAVPAAEQAGA